MLKSIAIKALLGTGAIGLAAGTTAFAASPSPSAAVQPSAQGSNATHKHAADRAGGVIVKLSDKSVTVERDKRDTTTRAVTKDDRTFVINAETKVYKAGDKNAVGRDALKLGERVRIRFAEKDGKQVARRVEILRDLRGGKVIAKGDNYIVIHTREHGDVKVVVSDKTMYFTGHGKGREKGTFSAIKVGDRLVAAGEEDSAHNFDAVRVHYSEKKPDPKATTPKAAAPATASPAQ